MDIRRPESAAIGLETRPRNWKKLKRAVAGIALASTVAVGLYADSSGSVSNKVKIEAEKSDTDGTRELEAADRIKAFELAEAKIRWNQALEQSNKVYYLKVMAWNYALEHRIIYDPARWNNLHQCEQGDSWYASGYNPADTAHKQKFEGGLGMSTVAWDMAVEDAAKRGVTLPDTALDATIDQQMQGAQVFYEDEGGGGWACHVSR